MLTNELFNTDYDRRITEGAVDTLEQRRIDDLNMKMDDLANRAKSTDNPEHKKSLLNAFLKCKEERDSYYKIKDLNELSPDTLKSYIKKASDSNDDRSVSGYATDYADKVHWDADEKNDPSERKLHLRSKGIARAVDKLEEVGIGQDIANKTEKIARATPQSKAGAVASTVKNAAKWLAGQGGPGKEGPTYEGADDIADRGEYDQEGDMVKDNLHTIRREAEELERILGNNENVPEWVQDKLAQVKGMITSASEYMQTQRERDHEEATGEEGVTIAEKKLGANRPKLGSARDIGKSVKKFRAQRGLDEAGTDSQWHKESDWKAIPKAKSGKPADPRGEVTHLSDVARREAERKADQKKNPEAVDEGWSDAIVSQRTGRPRTPYSVYIKGKKWKDFENDDHAEAVANKLRAKFRAEGRDPGVITIAPTDYDKGVAEDFNLERIGHAECPVCHNNDLDWDEDTQTVGCRGCGSEFEANGRQIKQDIAEAGDRVDPILYKALDRMQPGIAGQGQPGDDLFSAARTALATEWGLSALRSEYATATAYTRQLIDLYLAKHGAKQGMAEDTGSWIVYDLETKQIKKRFKTHTAGKSYAKVHGLGFASSEYYFDNIKQAVAETVTDVRAGMAKIYNKLAPKIERHRDSFLAGQLYDELENYAELHGAENEFKRMLAGARNRAHMDYDTNPGGFENWFWYLPFADEVAEEKTRLDPKCWTGKKIGTPKTKVKGGVRVNNCVPAEEGMFSPLEENNEARDAVESAIVRRIMVARTDLLKKFGPQKVMDAAQAIADDHTDVEEIGTSDVSAYVQQVERYLFL
jgi:hypothetical protein